MQMNVPDGEIPSSSADDYLARPVLLHREQGEPSVRDDDEEDDEDEEEVVDHPDEDEGKVEAIERKRFASILVKEKDSEICDVFVAARHRFMQMFGKNGYGKSFVTHWRLRQRMKTVGAALVLCLHIGVDPPDVVKTQPCARLECWQDPFDLPPQKALSTIGNRLQRQYERWQPKAKYKQCLDQTDEDLKRMCIGLRRNARMERLLFHYNGHGVPRPTSNGEIWVFNKNYTQYIPVSIFDLHSWFGSPAIYVFDCSAAGVLFDAFNQILSTVQSVNSDGSNSQFTKGSSMPDLSGVMNSDSHVNSDVPLSDANGLSSPYSRNDINPDLLHDIIALGACSAHEILPMNPELPADVFTSCLTTPIQIALRWFASNSFLCEVTPDDTDKLPGKPNDRKSPLGEMNWIFTAVTDTIAWNVLPPSLFQRLFRQDLLVASIFRNYLLAERMMRSFNCTPVSIPKLSETYQHPMWESWDLAAEFCLSQLAKLLRNEINESMFESCSFFSDQLTTFEIWLEFANEDTKPMQLPIVLQVLLSQSYRLRALQLLARFLDKGYWAVNLALSVGILPYISKLLQTPTPDLREVLVFIWAKILVLDRSCKIDLIKEQYHKYFIMHLNSSIPNQISHLQPSEVITPIQKVLNCFILSVLSDNNPSGQSDILSSKGLQILLQHVQSSSALVRRWALLAIAKLWTKYDEAHYMAIKDNVPEKLKNLLFDRSPEVRAASVYCLSSFICMPSPFTAANARQQEAFNLKKQLADLQIGKYFCELYKDASPIVRMEAIIAFCNLVCSHKELFVETARLIERDSSNFEEKMISSSAFELSKDIVLSILIFRYDPIIDIAECAHTIASAILPVPQRTSQAINFSPSLSVSSGSFPSELDSLSSSHPPSGIHVPPKNEESIKTGSISQSTSAININARNSESLDVLGDRNSLRAEKRGPDAIMQNHKELLPLILRKSEFYEWSCEFINHPLLKQSSSLADFNDVNSGVQLDNLYNNDLSSPLNKNVQEESSGIPGMIIDEAEMDSNSVYFDELDADINYCFSQLAKERSMMDRNLFISNEVKSALRFYDDKRRFDEEIAIFQTDFKRTSKVLLHSYDPLMIATDYEQRIGIWNYEEGYKVNMFSNHTSKFLESKNKVTSLKIINESSDSMLLCGSDDGVIRIWKNYQVQGEQRLASAWVASVKVTKPGMIVDWLPARSSLLVASGSESMKLWDVNQERPFLEIPVPLNSNSVQSMCSDYRGNLVYVGFGDGSVRWIDLRIRPDLLSLASGQNLIAKHSGKVVSVCLQRKGESNGQLISAGIRGHVFINDPRSTQDAPIKFKPHPDSPLNTMTVHDYAPLIATGSSKQFVVIMKTDGTIINKIRHHDGFLGQRIGPVHCLAFHPYKLLLAAGGKDSYISIMQSTSA